VTQQHKETSVLKLNDLCFPKKAVKKRTRKGRGNASGHGGECGRGHKGQKSRSGYSRKAGFEGGQMPLYKRIPKLRGFRNPGKIRYEPVNIAQLEKYFKESDRVTMEALFKIGIAPKDGLVKILGVGTLSKNLHIEVHKVSKVALEKIKKSGSTIELLG